MIPMHKKPALLILIFALCTLVACDKKASDEAPTAQANPAENANVAASEGAGEAAEALGEPGAAAAAEAAAAAAKAPAHPVVGQLAPDFTLVDETGKSHTLSDYRGKTVVLEWFNIPCPYVNRHYKADTFGRTISEAGIKDLVWLAIDTTHDNLPENSIEWKKTAYPERSADYPILQDPDGTIGRLYEAKTTPHMFVIDAEGIVRYMGGIDDDPRGQSESPTNYVLNALKSIQAGEEVAVTTAKPYGCTVKYKGE